MNLFNRQRRKSVQISAPKSYDLHGVAIHKLPIVKYVQVMEAAENLPALLLGEAFPDAENLTELAASITRLDRDTMLTILTRLLKFVPVQFCELLSQLLDIPKERLLDPKSENPLSLAELMDVILAFVDINDLSNFFMTVRSLKQKLHPVSEQSKQNTGFKDLLQ